MTPVGAAPPDVLPGLDALRDGRFEEAEAGFSRITATTPAEPEGPFFEAFQIWWRLIDHPEDTTLRLSMEERLGAASRTAMQMADGSDPEQRQRGLLFQGVAQMLDAQSKAVRGSRFKAASLVRQGHRALTAALEANPDDEDALFAMGAYNYYADHLPVLVKGLGFLLLIPGGDSAKGIRQLEAAADHSRLFGAESLMLLAHIFSGGYEENYPRALGYVDRARARYPDSPLIGLARADLLFKLGRLHESADLSMASLERITGHPGYAIEIERALSYRLSACRLKLYDPLGALDSIETSLGRSLPATLAEKKRWVSLLVESTREAGHPERLEPWLARLDLPESVTSPVRRRIELSTPDGLAPERAEALRTLAGGRTDEATRRLETLLVEHPNDPRLRYDMGRILQHQGHLDQALPHLQAVVAADRLLLPVDMTGWALLRIGWQLEQQGRRSEAITYYRKAAAMKQFTFQPDALVRLDHPVSTPPEG